MSKSNPPTLSVASRSPADTSPPFRWLRSGASHHTCMTTSVGREAWEDFARIAGVELATIDANTKAAEFERDLEISEMYHRLNNRH